MILLSIDTSCKTAMAAVAREEEILASVTIQDHKTHSVKLLPAIEYILSAAGVVPADLDLIAVTNGPGSYTGLRIGVTTAKTFAYALGKSVIGINSLEALAASCAASPGMLVCPLMDARNARVYAAVYRNGEALQDVRAVSCEALCETLKTQYPAEQIFFIGDGAIENDELLRGLLGNQYVRVPVELGLGSPAAVSMLALRKYQKAAAAGNTLDFTPDALKVNYYKNYTDTI